MRGVGWSTDCTIDCVSNAAWSLTESTSEVKLAGELRMPDATRVWRALRKVADATKEPRLDIDLGEVRVVDGAVMALLVEVRSALAERGVACTITGVPGRLEPIVHLYGGDEPPLAHGKLGRVGPIARLGAASAALGKKLRVMLTFLGDVVAALRGFFGGPAAVNLRAVPRLAERAGADGIPIVLLLNFLVGFVMGFQSARQLALYGANVYVADVVGISVSRELAPLMTAIIMSGRSGAAFAAELGSMRVAEEIDALRTMGFAPAPYLVLPRVIALALVAPMLTLLGDVVGIAGGVAVAISSLGVSARGYLAELRTAVFPSDVWTGLVKSVAFAIAIAFIGCQQGFATRGAAEGVGRSTTTTVVSCLFAIVIIDTLFTMIFQTYGR